MEAIFATLFMIFMSHQPTEWTKETCPGQWTPEGCYISGPSKSYTNNEPSVVDADPVTIKTLYDTVEVETYNTFCDTVEIETYNTFYDTIRVTIFDTFYDTVEVTVPKRIPVLIHDPTPIRTVTTKPDPIPTTIREPDLIPVVSACGEFDESNISPSCFAPCDGFGPYPWGDFQSANGWAVGCWGCYEGQWWKYGTCGSSFPFD